MSDKRQESSNDLAGYGEKIPRPKHPYSCGMSGVYDRRMFEISERDKPIPVTPSITQDQWVGGRFQRRHNEGTLTSNLLNSAHVKSQTAHTINTTQH